MAQNANPSARTMLSEAERRRPPAVAGVWRDGHMQPVYPIRGASEDWCADIVVDGNVTMVDWATLEDSTVYEIVSQETLENEEVRERLGLDE